MTEIAIAGPIESALTHFAGLGLASVLDGAGAEDIMLFWTDEIVPQLHLRTAQLSEQEIAKVVHEHAESLNSPDSWIHATIDHEKRKDTGLFSPRIKAPGSRESWTALTQTRQQHIDQLIANGDLLSLEMIGGLGEPASWRFEKSEARPDHGASRWEMKTRNRGEEFVGNRFAPLCDVVAARTSEAVLDGIVGRKCVDELDSKATSRTSTGFQRPGPTDSVLAWLALWGLTSFPVRPRLSSISQTAGAFPQDVLHTSLMVLPIVTRPTSLARWRGLIAHAVIRRIGEDLVDGNQTIDMTVASPLRELGAVALGTARVLLQGSASAPERVVLDLEVVPLAEKDYGSDSR